MSGCSKEQENCLAYVRYIREKTNQLLEVMGTDPLHEEELDDHALIELDPIGTIAQSFGHILEYLNETIRELQVAKDELQAIFDATGVGISIIDKNYRILRCNEKRRLKTLPAVTALMPMATAIHRLSIARPNTPLPPASLQLRGRSSSGENISRLRPPRLHVTKITG